MTDPSPVTIVVSRTVRAGREAEFEDAVREWIPEAVAFPGHEGVFMLHPHSGSREYGAVLRFRSKELWNEFAASPSYLAFLSRIWPLLEQAPNVQVLNGLEAWFPWSGGSAPVPRWKMAVVTWVGVCLTVGVLSILLGPFLSHWKWLASLLVMNAAVVVALTWCVMPAVIRVFRPWLQSDISERVTQGLSK